jgi:CDP-diacylglycerol--serine O-phosphatidyltransferase
MSRRAARRERRRRSRAQRERRRAIYLLPNVVTTASLLLGFWSIVQSFHGNYERAATAIVLAGLCDMLDGRIARATHSTSKFGVEYDSIADMISFGVAPAILVYAWMLVPLGPRGWLIASLFSICAALRLARFNVQQHVEERERYQGLPSTLAGGFTAVSIWFFHWIEVLPPFGAPLGLAITASFAVVALLMVSSLPYVSLKSVPFSLNNFTALVAIALALIAILLHPEPMMFGIGALYVLSGPVVWLLELRWRPSAEAPETSSADRGAQEVPTRHVP